MKDMLWREWVQMKNNLVTVETVYIYTDTLLKKGFVHFAYNRFVVGLIFCTQNLIRDG